MLRRILLSALVGMLSASEASASLVVNFDDASKWVAGTGGDLGSYQTNHVYADLGLTFTGGPAVRETAGIQDIFPSTNSGAYAWRLNQNADIAWTAAYSTIYAGLDIIEGFSFDLRRWDATPAINRTIEFSTNGGSTFTPLQLITNVFLNNTSNWTTYSYTLADPIQVQAGDFVVRITGSSSTPSERMMIDNFALATIPEPTSALFGSLIACAFGLTIARRPAGRD